MYGSGMIAMTLLYSYSHDMTLLYIQSGQKLTRVSSHGRTIDFECID